jgi:hypothetical protein
MFKNDEIERKQSFKIKKGQQRVEARKREV